MSAVTKSRYGYFAIFLVMALGFFPLGIRAYDPFSLHAQTRPPLKPRFQTQVLPGDQSAAAKHSCKDPVRLELEHRRIMRVTHEEHEER